MATMPLYGKLLKKNNNKKNNNNSGPLSVKLGMLYQGLLSIMVCSNDDAGLTLLYLIYGKSKFCNLGFSIRKKESSDYFKRYYSVLPESW